MRTAKLASLAGLLGAAVLAAFWAQREQGANVVERDVRSIDTLTETVGPSQRVVADAAADSVAPAPVRQPAVGARYSEEDLRARFAERAFALGGVATVEYFVAGGLDRSDGERIARAAFHDSTRCLFDAMRFEAEAQAVDYDTVLDALDADLHNTDGPLLGAVLDMAAVQDRSESCVLTVMQQAGIPPPIFRPRPQPASR